MPRLGPSRALRSTSDPGRAPRILGRRSLSRRGPSVGPHGLGSPWDSEWKITASWLSWRGRGASSSSSGSCAWASKYSPSPGTDAIHPFVHPALTWGGPRRSIAYDRVGALCPVGLSCLCRLREIDWSEFRPFAEVEAAQKVLLRIANELQRRPLVTTSPDDASRRRAHFLPAARQAAARGRLEELRRPRSHLHDDAGFFFGNKGGLAPVVEATQCGQRRCWRCGSCRKARGRRTRTRPFVREQIARCVGGGAQAIHYADGGWAGRRKDEEIKAFEAHWGVIFGSTPEVDDVASARLLHQLSCLGASGGYRLAILRGVLPGGAPGAGQRPWAGWVAIHRMDFVHCCVSLSVSGQGSQGNR